MAYARLIRPLLSGAIALFLFFPLVSCSAVQASESITAETLAVQIEQGTAPLVLDVRSPAEYAEGHVPGAINVHFKEIPEQLDAIREAAVTANSSEIVVYCEQGGRAGIAENLLTEAGFASVIQLTGDMPAWREAELPITTAK